MLLNNGSLNMYYFCYFFLKEHLVLVSDYIVAFIVFSCIIFLRMLSYFSLVTCSVLRLSAMVLTVHPFSTEA